MPSTSSTGATARADRAREAERRDDDRIPAGGSLGEQVVVAAHREAGLALRPRLLEQVQDRRDRIAARSAARSPRMSGRQRGSVSARSPWRRRSDSARASPPPVRRNAAIVAATSLMSPAAANARRRMPSTARSPGCSRIIDVGQLEREVGVAGGERRLGLAHARPQAGQPPRPTAAARRRTRRHRRPPGEALRSPPSRASRPAPPCAPSSARCASARPRTDRLR